MRNEIEMLVTEYERGQMSRRELIGGLCAVSMAMSGAGASAAESKSTFVANGLNHLAMRTPDVAKSRDFYVKHLGLEVTRDSGSSCFMSCDDDFVALFEGDKAEMDHFCFSVENFEVGNAEKKLKAEGLKVRRTGGRIYFDDPHGIEVQLAAKDHGA
jgi:catechol-2,3-dioxygenase